MIESNKNKKKMKRVEIIKVFETLAKKEKTTKFYFISTIFTYKKK